MPQVDAALEVGVVGGHVVGADEVVETLAGAPHRRHHVIAGTELGDVLAHRLDPPEALVTRDQEVVSLGGRAVLGRVDLLVGPVDADAQHLDEHPAPARDVAHARLGELGEVHRVGTPGEHRDGFHELLLRVGAGARRVARFENACHGSVISIT